MKKNTLLIVSLIIAGSMMSLPQASASTIDSAVKNLNTSLNQFVSAKDDASIDRLSPEEDLAFRKKVVSDALTLSLKEIEDIRNKIGTLKLDDKSPEGIVSKQILGDLGEFEAHYRDVRSSLDEENDVEKIKDVARSTKEYRDDAYSPVILKALNLILTFQTDKLVKSADIRYTKIGSDISKLEKANLIKDGAFDKQMGEADKLISGAGSMVEESKDIVLDRNKDKNIDNIYDAPKDEKIVSPRELCEAALVNLKSSYGIFIDISSAIKKALKL